jgi:hypothetical protein
MLHWPWYNALIEVSSYAAGCGLWLSLSHLFTNIPWAVATPTPTASALVPMAFLNWLMYCLAYELQVFLAPGPSLLLLILKLLAMLALGVTLCCVLSLPFYWLEIKHHQLD